MNPEPKVIELGAHSNLTAEQVLAVASREEWIDVIICGYHKDNGALVVRSSKMSRQDCLWIMEHTKLHAMGRL